MNAPSCKSGMTLIELVIVLALMAGLAGLTLSTVGELGHRERQDQTLLRFERIREGVERLRQDLGRGPWLHNDTDGIRLEELWRDAGALSYGDVSLDPAWSEFSGVLPASVSLRFGWNGPYIGVDDAASAELWDGFGNAWDITESGGILQSITSLGSDGAVGGTLWHEEDLTLNLAAAFPTTELTVIVVRGALALDTLRVSLFRPNSTDSARSVAHEIETIISPDTVSDVTFLGLLPGNVRIFAHGFTVGSANLWSSGTTPRLVHLKPGSNVITLTLEAN